MSVTGDGVRFIVRLNWRGLVTFRRDRGCGRAAMLAICRAVVGGRARVCDVTPAEVDELAEFRSVSDPEWEDRLIRFAARQRVGGLIEIERDCGCDPRDVLDLCESLLDGRDLDEVDDTRYHRHIAPAGRAPIVVRSRMYARRHAPPVAPSGL
ncbi:MAG TPA: hypothetical protein VGD67_02555 [Pseudonocardiaceae bacterium]